ncbi:MAG: flagellar filament capping protein FliD [Phycisphaerae bacterium]|nr:flagellar filament capping protein FliD [Phycisphaerae bacterium]
MGTLSFPGLSTGLDTAKIIEQLMEVNSRKLNLMKSNLTVSETKKEAYTELQSKLTSVKTAMSALNNSSVLKSFKAVTSDSDIISAEASSDAYEGNHSVKVKQLATAERWVHSGISNSTAYVGAGNFIFSYNNKELIIQTTEETTLEDMVGLINNDTDNPGVTASILKYDSGTGNAYHLVLNGKDSGSDYQITVNATNTEVRKANTELLENGETADVDTKLEDLDGFTGELESGSTADQIHITGTRHDNTAVDYYFDVTHYTTIDDVLTQINEAFETAGVRTAVATYEDGVIRLTDKTSGASSLDLAMSFVPGTGSTASLALPTFILDGDEGGTVSASVAAFAPATFTETRSAQDSLIKVDDFPTGADDWISRSSNTIDDVISGVTLHLHDTSYNGTGYDNIEVNLTRDTEALKEKIDTLVTTYNAAVLYIKDKTAFDADGKTRGILSTEYNVLTIWSQMKEPFNSATKGFGSRDSFTSPSDIGLTLNAEGMLELDEKALDEAIVDDYNGVLDLIGTDKTGDSTSDAIKFYSANKYTTASQYEVRVYGNGTAITSAQIREVGETTWRDATFSGNTVTGNSTFNSYGTPLYAENSLQFTVDVSQTSGTPLTATISVKQGFAGAAYDVLNTNLDSVDGSLTITTKSIDQAIKNQNDRIEEEEERLEKERERLVAQYARLETLLSQLQRQMSSVTSMSS